ERPGHGPSSGYRVQGVVAELHRQIPDVTGVQAVPDVIVGIAVVQSGGTEGAELIQQTVGEAVRQNTTVGGGVERVAKRVAERTGESVRELLLHGGGQAVVVGNGVVGERQNVLHARVQGRSGQVAESEGVLERILQQFIIAVIADVVYGHYGA